MSRNEQWLVDEWAGPGKRKAPGAWQSMFAQQGFLTWKLRDKFAVGRPDILLLRDGIAILAEVKWQPVERRKDPAGLLTPHQLRVRDALLNVRMRYLLIVGWPPGDECLIYTFGSLGPVPTRYRRLGPGRWERIP